MFLGLQAKLGLVPATRAHEVVSNLLMLSRAQYAVELAHSRIREATAELDELEAQPGKSSEAIDVLLRRYADLHHFLVSASLFWRTLKELAKRLDVPELAEAVTKSADVSEHTTRARHHIEHVTERISSGCSPGRAPEMTADVFRGLARPPSRGEHRVW
jgi:hypothetical protein